VEMQTTADEKQKIREIIQHLIDGDRQWISDNWILASNKATERPYHEPGGYIRFSDPGCSSTPNSQPQGWQGDPLSLIKSFPFVRFFNHGEKEGAPINFGNAEMLEKMDGCLSKDTKIAFCDGTEVRIKDVVEQKLVGPVWGFDPVSGEVVSTEILAWHDNGLSNDWVTVDIDDPHNGNNKKVVHATSNHLFFSLSYNKQPIFSKTRAEIPQGEYVEAAGMKDKKVFVLRDSLGTKAKQMVLGTMLGDASLSYSGGWRISWCHKNEQMPLTQFYCKLLEPLNPCWEYDYQNEGFGDNKHRCTICATQYFEEFAEICLQNSKKKISDEWLKQLSWLSLAVWYMDDGSISLGNNQRPRALLHTEGFSEKDNEIIIDALWEKFELKAVKQNYRSYTCLRLNADDAEKFWHGIARCIIPSMRYKLPEELRDLPCIWENYEPEAFCKRVSFQTVLDVHSGNYRASKKGHTRKYDITTGTHNFFANGVLVHNSMVGVFFPEGDPARPH